MDIADYTDIAPDDLCILWHTEVITLDGRGGVADVLGGALSLVFGAGTSAQNGKARGQIRRGIAASQTQTMTITHRLERTPPDHPLFEARFRVVIKRAIRRGDVV